MVLEEISFEIFQDGHLGYQNGTILAILNNCHCDASHQVLTQSDIVLEETSFEEFQDGGHLEYRNGTIFAILNLCDTVMPPIKFQLNRTKGL